jgi:ubiquinone/menaquinone biosynthesis C-methylase UbiE
MAKADYGNFFPNMMLIAIAVVWILLLALSVFLTAIAASAVFVAASIAVTAVIIVFFVLVAYARYVTSARGGNAQAQYWELVLGNLDWDGEGQALDIGCGNGPIAIGVAKRFPNAHVTGIDIWPRFWGYSQRTCERNAEIEGVADRVNFQKASASALPFDDEHFDAAVSSFVFHEVHDLKDKRDVVKEALRVVKKGGAFAFLDPFLHKRTYGDFEDLLATVRSWGVSSVEFTDTSHADFIPKVLRIIPEGGASGILHGSK